jgi:hypothetical protein
MQCGISVGSAAVYLPSPGRSRTEAVVQLRSSQRLRHRGDRDRCRVREQADAAAKNGEKADKLDVDRGSLE